MAKETKVYVINPKNRQAYRLKETQVNLNAWCKANWQIIWNKYKNELQGQSVTLKNVPCMLVEYELFDKFLSDLGTTADQRILYMSLHDTRHFFLKIKSSGSNKITDTETKPVV